MGRISIRGPKIDRGSVVGEIDRVLAREVGEVEDVIGVVVDRGRGVWERRMAMGIRMARRDLRVSHVTKRRIDRGTMTAVETVLEMDIGMILTGIIGIVGLWTSVI